MEESGVCMRFRHRQKLASANDDASTLFAFEMQPIESAEGRRSLSARMLINGLTVTTLLVLLVVSIPLWVHPVQQVWTRVFPPPPYTGPLIFIQEGDQLTARRIIDGTMQWKLLLKMHNNSVIQYGDMLYISSSTDNNTASLEAVRPQDGHALWQTTRQGYDFAEVIGKHDSQLYILYRNGPTGSGILAALDVHTGQPQWVTTDLTNAEGYLTGDRILLCQENTSSDGQSSHYVITALNRLTGTQYWSHTFALQESGQSNGYSCGIAATQAVIDLSPAQTGALYAFDVQTGVLSWHRQVGPSFAVMGQDTIYLTTWPGEGAPPTNAGTDDTLQAVRASDGIPVWSIPGKYLLLQGVGGMPQGMVLAHTPGGLAGLDAQTGTVKWRWASSTSTTDSSNWNVIGGVGNILTYSDSNEIQAVKASSGQVLWHRNTQSAIPNMTVDGQQLYISDLQHIEAVNVNTGKLRWQISIPAVAPAQFVYCLTCNG